MTSPVRRTTIVVSDLGRSLFFYRDILGLQVFYDQELRGDATGKLLGMPGAHVRLVSLQSEGSVAGMVGLLSFLSPDHKPRRRLSLVGAMPDVMLLFLAEGIGQIYERALGAGIPIVCEPIEYEVPARGAISGFGCYDPDRVLVAVMRLGQVADDRRAVHVAPVRRTTIAVGDIDRSLAFYRGALGLRVYYDQEITSAGEGRMLGIPGARVRMVALKGEGPVVGTVGLLSLTVPPAKPREPMKTSVAGPDVGLIFLTDDMTALYGRLSAAGVAMSCPPTEYEIPGRGLSAGLSCYDPDHVFVEFTQFAPLRA